MTKLYDEDEPCRHTPPAEAQRGSQGKNIASPYWQNFLLKKQEVEILQRRSQAENNALSLNSLRAGSLDRCFLAFFQEGDELIRVSRQSRK
jgi:hypothetical protein